MKYPIFLNLESKRAVVIGGGSVAARKIISLIDSKARIVLVADHIDQALETECLKAGFEVIIAKYSKEYLVGATIAFAATNDRKVNQQIYKDCQELEILCNVPDNPELCDFFVPAVLKRGDLQIAVCTQGASPAYAGHIRKKLEEIFTEKHGDFLSELEQTRERIMAEVTDSAQRKVILGELAGDASFDYYLEHGPEQWQKNTEEKIKSLIANS